MPVSLTVNGARVDLRIEPRVTLLDALRNRADLTGNKRVCDRGSCGACTMIVDGRTVYACSTLAIDVQGKPIRTVDGLAKGDVLHPVQQAFCDADALMCGFCTPGFVVATVALLEKYPNATREQAAKELDGNVCRCGTFVRIMEAAGHARSGVGSRDSGFASANPVMLESPRIPNPEPRIPTRARCTPVSIDLRLKAQWRWTGSRVTTRRATSVTVRTPSFWTSAA